MAAQGASCKKSLFWEGNAANSNGMTNKVEILPSKFNENVSSNSKGEYVISSGSDCYDKSTKNSGCAVVSITCNRKIGKTEYELMLAMDHNRGLLNHGDQKDKIFPCCCPNNQISRSSKTNGSTSRLSSDSGDDMENYYNAYASDIVGGSSQTTVHNGHKTSVSNFNPPILNMTKCLEFKETNGSTDLLDKSNLSMLRNFRLETNSVDYVPRDNEFEQVKKSPCSPKDEQSNEHNSEHRRKDCYGLGCGRSASASSTDPSSSSILQSPDMDFLDFDFDPTPNGDDFFSSMIDTDYDTASNQDLEDDANFTNEMANNLSDSVNTDIQERFVQSLSFHNQLSSPKFQNTSMGETSFDLLYDETVNGNDSNISEGENNTAQGDCSSGNSLNISGEEHLIEESNQAVKNADKSIRKDSLSLSEDPILAHDTSNVLLKPLEKVMIWSETEAFSLQVAQIGTSACGATAVINVLIALQQIWDKEKVTRAVHTRMRAEGAHIPEYLFSRSVAGTTHEDLIKGMEEITNGSIYGKFFWFHPPRKVDLSRWLAYWLKRGAVPIATLNLQRGVAADQTIPDAWHHQMIFGIGPRGIYLTNPLECLTEPIILQQLCCDSALLVRREDIIMRWEDGCDLYPLIQHSDTRWRELNVLGQVINVLREWTSFKNNPKLRPLVTHIAIPAAYKAGITLFVTRNSEAFQELADSHEFPLFSS